MSPNTSCITTELPHRGTATIENLLHWDITKTTPRNSGDMAILFDTARTGPPNLLSRRILVIEDELKVAQEITDIVTSLGHQVIGNAANRREAIEIAEAEKPDLIVSDIQLANGGSGIQAVNAILRLFPMTPVVYITGFPERLTSGKGPKPAFLVTKPYRPEQIRAAVSQAASFA